MNAIITRPNMYVCVTRRRGSLWRAQHDVGQYGPNIVISTPVAPLLYVVRTICNQAYKAQGRGIRRVCIVCNCGFYSSNLQREHTLAL